MTPTDLAHRRLHAQHLASVPLARAEDVVRWLVAVQSQDFGGSKWAVAQRTAGLTEAAFDAAFDDGRILRTHVLRPTWHLVTPDDIGWMLALSAPRVLASNASRYRDLGLDAALRARSDAIVAKALEGAELTRDELAGHLERAGIPLEFGGSRQRLPHLIMHAELGGLICSGRLRGRETTYALLDARAPRRRRLARDEALAELARRYFASHGPATLKDFTWWSGLSAADAKAALASVEGTLALDGAGGITRYFVDAARPPRARTGAFLLPDFDELLVGYADRSAITGDVPPEYLDARESILAKHTLVVGGRVRGTWTRTLRAKSVAVGISCFESLDAAQRRATVAAAERYAAYLGRALSLTITPA